MENSINIQRRPHSKTVRERLTSNSRIKKTIESLRFSSKSPRIEKNEKDDRIIKKNTDNQNDNKYLKYTSTSIFYSYSVLPIIVIEDKYYKSIIEYLKSEELSKIYKKSYTVKREEIYKKEYKTLPLNKLLRPLSTIHNYSIPKFKESDKNDIESFLADAIQYYTIYTEVEKNIIVQEIKNDNNYFRENFDIKIEQWAIQLFNALKYFIRIKLEKFPFINQKKGAKYPSLFICSTKKMDYNDIIDSVELSSFHKMFRWNILLYTQSKNRSINELYGEYDFIDNEINSDFIIINNEEYLKAFINLLTEKNKELYNLEVKIKFTLLLEETDAKEFLQSLKKSNYDVYFNKILILCHKKEPKMKMEINQIHKVNGFFEDKNEIISFFMNNVPSPFTMSLKEIITLTKYQTRYHILHEKIAKEYNNFSQKKYESAKEDFIQFLNSYEKNIKINKHDEKINNDQNTENQILNIKFKKNFSSMITKNDLLDFITIFGNFDENRHLNILKNFFNEENLNQKNFNHWLKTLDNINYDKISYFVADLINCMNKYELLGNHGLTGQHKLLKKFESNLIEVLKFSENEGNIITFPNFLSTNKSETLQRRLSSFYYQSEIETRVEKGNFFVLMIIDYNCQKNDNQIPSCIDFSEFNITNNKIFLPFSFFRVNEVKINMELCIATIKLKAINRRQVLEEYLYFNNNIKYDDIKEEIGIEKVKNILIHDENINILNELYEMVRFLEFESSDYSSFLVSNKKEYFSLISDEIKNQNITKNDKKNLIKFELILFEGSTKFPLDYIKEKNMREFFDSIIIISSEKEKYKKELDEKIVDVIINNKISLIKYIKEKVHGSYFPLNYYRLITFTKYNASRYIFHLILSKYYQKICNNYLKTANEIFVDFLISNTLDLKIDIGEQTLSDEYEMQIVKKKELIKGMEVFFNSNKNDLNRYISIIKAYTSEEYSFYKDFNYWLSEMDPFTYEKTGYFISDFILSLNKYAELCNKGLIGKRTLYRGLIMKFPDLLLYEQNLNEIITFTSFTSTSLSKKVAERFSDIDEIFEEDDPEKSEFFSVVMQINYDCNKNQKPNAIDIDNISTYNEEERLILPFTFFQIKNVTINENNKKAKIELNVINKEQIIEEQLTEKDILLYNKEKNIIENKKRKIIEYNVPDDQNEIRIFGDKFVKNNKLKLLIKIKGKTIPICSKYKFSSKGINTIELIEKEQLEDFSNMFHGCIYLTSVNNFKNWDMNNIKKTDFMFYKCSKITSIDSLKNWNMSNLISANSMFSGCTKLASIFPLKNWNMINVNYMSSMFSGCSSLTSIDDLKYWKFDNLLDCRYMFANCYSITSLEALKLWNVKNLMECAGMFYGCSSIQNLRPLKNWKIMNLYNTSYMFYGCVSLTSIEPLQYWDMSNVIYINNMFDNCNKIKYISSLKQWDVDKVENANYLFRNCYNISSIDELKYWKFNHLIQMMGMFENCINIKSIEPLKNWNIKNVENISYMFSGCSSLESIDELKNWDTSNVKKINNIFSGCCNIKSIDALKNWNVKNVENISYMFYGCNSLESIDALKIWNTVNVKNSNNIFFGCSNIKSINALKNWNTKNVENISYMFYGCNSLESIDALGNWNTSKIENTKNMFSGCVSLKSIEVLGKWNTKNFNDTSGMFYDCKLIKDIENLKYWNMEKVKDISYMFSGCTLINDVYALRQWDLRNIENACDMLYGCPVKSLVNLYYFKKLPQKPNLYNNKIQINSDIKNQKLKKIIYYFDKMKWETNIFGKNFTIRNKNKIQLKIEDKIIPICHKYLFKESKKYIVEIIENEKLTNLSGMFKNCYEIKSLEFENWDMENITNISSMFHNCASLIKLNFKENWNMKNIKNISNLFDGCISLTSIDFVSNWDTSNFISTESAFKHCSKLSSIEALKNWKVNNIIEMNSMFSGCYSIKYIEALKNWKTYNLNNTTKMFNGCSSIKSIEALKNWDMKNVQLASEMFSGCININSIDCLQNWNMDSIIEIYGIFSDCENIKSIDSLKNWNISKVKNTSDLFKNCINLISIDALKNWDMKNVFNTSCMFFGCNLLKSIDSLKNWEIKNLKNCSGMFYNCSNITSIDSLINWNMYNVENVSYMFNGCTKIESIDSLKNWEMDNVKEIQYFLAECSNITSINALENWNTINVKNSCYMFKNCKSINSIDALANWNMSNNEYMQYMFYGCSKLKSVNALKNWSINKAKFIQYMFCGCSGVENSEVVTKWKLNNVENVDGLFLSYELSKKFYYNRNRRKSFTEKFFNN